MSDALQALVARPYDASLVVVPHPNGAHWIVSDCFGNRAGASADEAAAHDAGEAAIARLRAHHQRLAKIVEGATR